MNYHLDYIERLRAQGSPLEALQGAEAIVALLQAGINARDTKGLPQAKKILLKAGDLAKKKGYLPGLYQALQQLWYIELKQNKPLKPLMKKIGKALSELKKYQRIHPVFQALTADLYALLGNCAVDVRLENWKTGKKAYENGLAIARKIKYHKRVSTILGDLILVALFGEKDFSKATKYAIETVRLARKHNHHALPAALLRLGKIWFDGKNPKRNLTKALAYYQRSLTVARKENWKREQADALDAIASVKEIQGKTKEMRTLRTHAKALYRKLGYAQ